MANKIKFGLKSLYYAIGTQAANGTMTYGTPVAFPGAVSISLDPVGDTNNFYADNIVYWTGNANNGYEGELEVARVIDSFETDVLGFIADSKNVVVESPDSPTVHFALMFQFEGDVKATRHVLYNCTASRPSVSGSTKNETIEPQTETLTINCATIYNASLDKDITKAKTNEETDATTYSEWFSAVYLPTAQA